MSSSDIAAARSKTQPEARENATGVGALLDTVFGHFVWAAHFLFIYIATAVACQLGLGTAATGTRRTFLAVLAVVTVAAAGLVVLHAIRRHREQRDQPDRRIRLGITIGNDAIATLAIAGQLLAITLVPLCV